MKFNYKACNCMFIVIFLNRDEKEFIRFLNMAINDVTYLLDESLQLLKKIRDIETDMDNKEEWEATAMVLYS